MKEYLPYFFPLVLVALIIYRRIKRVISAQKYSKNGLVFRTIVLSFVGVVFFVFGRKDWISLAAEGTGILSGIGLFLLAKRHTIFEKKENALYYRTHIWIEMAILILFFVRLAYRFYLLYPVLQAGHSPQEVRTEMMTMRDPWTSVLFFGLFAYYLAYSVFILKEGEKLRKQ